MKSIGFKEWALVCSALGSGAQSIILRKGGIAEMRRGFSFEHPEFFLFPTFFHEQLDRVRTGAQLLPRQEGNVRIQFYAKVERALRIDSLAVAEALAPLHILAVDVVRERFKYGDSGIDVALVRIFALAQAWLFPDEKRFGGCRSWVELPAAPRMELTPVLSEGQHARVRERFDSIVSARSQDLAHHFE